MGYTFVKCTDGKLYRGLVYHSPKSADLDPAAKAGRDWFVCFDYNDPVEVVIRNFPGAPSVGTVVAALGLPIARVHRGIRQGRVFNGRIREATAHFVDVRNVPFPSPVQGRDEWDAVLSSGLRPEGCYYGG